MNYMNPDSNDFRPDLEISLEQGQLIESILDELVTKLPACFALLTDTNGQVVRSEGNIPHDGSKGIDMVALGALVASDLAASREISRLSGDYEDFQMTLREGRTHHILISEVGERLALLVQIHRETPLGWARMMISDGARRLADIMTMAAPAKKEWSPIDPVEGHTADLGDLLDDIWTEETGSDVH